MELILQNHKSNKFHTIRKSDLWKNKREKKFLLLTRMNSKNRDDDEIKTWGNGCEMMIYKEKHPKM
jgi:hypothetical protein